MKISKCPTNKSKLAVLLASVLLLTGAPAWAWELGVVNTYQYNPAPERWDYGATAMLRGEIWRYCDFGTRIGYMRSDALGVDYIPIRISADLKYSLFDGHFVPFAGMMLGLNFFTANFQPGEFIGPNFGFDWRFGKDRKWSLFAEGFYQLKDHVHFESNNAEFQLDSAPGFSLGVSYHF